MDINEIINSLGLDFSDPETKRGAIEAIEAILSSREKPELAGSSQNGEAEEIEVDPNLLMPSKKYDADGSEIDIEDEDDLLSKVQFNDSEEDDESELPEENHSESQNTDNNDTSIESDSSETNASGGSSSSSSGEAAKSDSGLDADDAENNTDSAKDLDSSEMNQDGEEGAEADKPIADENSEHTDNDGAEDSDQASKQKSNEGTPGESQDNDEEDSEEDSEEDLLDSEINNKYNDAEKQSKYDSRKIKRERTLKAAKKALADAKAKNAKPVLIKELENAIASLEELQEATKKTLWDMTDDEFNTRINRVFDAIDALGNSNLSYSSDKDRELRAKEIKNNLSKASTQAELSAEDVAKIRAENQAIKARDSEAAKYTPKSRNSFKGFSEFLNSLYRAIAMQVQSNEVRNDSWSAINRRYNGTGVLKQGQRMEELPDKIIPIIDFYFNQSGSWTADDVKKGEEAVKALADMQKKGDIKLNIFYFANHVHTVAEDARAEGGTNAWNDIVKNIISTKATNVVIMTDSDMEHFGYWGGETPLKYTVPGRVWYLWRDGENAPRLPRDLQGRGGTQQFSFSSSRY